MDHYGVCFFRFNRYGFCNLRVETDSIQFNYDYVLNPCIMADYKIGGGLMPNILIWGMEMPKHCIDCPCMVDKYGGDNCCLQSEEVNEKITSWDDMKAGCPLHELPEHGDLIDIRNAENAQFQVGNYHLGDYKQGWNDGIDAIIENAPVVIPANKEDAE